MSDEPETFHPIASVAAPIIERAPRRDLGPLVTTLEPIERAARFRSLATAAALLIPHSDPRRAALIAAFRGAERSDQDAARAHALVEAMPSITRRRLLSTYGAVNLGRPRAA